MAHNSKILPDPDAANKAVAIKDTGVQLPVPNPITEPDEKGIGCEKPDGTDNDYPIYGAPFDEPL